MRRRSGRPLLLLTGLLLVASACGGDTAETTTTTLPPETTTTQPVVVTTTPETTTTLAPGGPPLIAEGDRGETVAAFQWLLACGGHGTLTVDGNYGPGTGAVLASALATLGRAVPDEDAFADLSRGCDQVRPLELDEEFTVFGNAAPDDPEAYSLNLAFDTAITIAVEPSDGLLVTLLGPTGVVQPQLPGGTPTTTTTVAGTTTTTVAGSTTTITLPVPTGPETTWSIVESGDYTIVITPDFEPITFTLTIGIGEDASGIGDWQLTTTGITYRGTKLSLGDNGEDTIDKIFEFLGHGVRGGGEFDTGWDTPGQEGIRGVAIEGFRFLFFGPSPGELVRIRVFAPTTDAAGNPRPEFYAMTPQGIGPGHTLAYLLEVYPGVTPGESDDGDHWYRLTNSGGELCFYFGTTEPDDDSEIVEMATECRD